MNVQKILMRITLATSCASFPFVNLESNISFKASGIYQTLSAKLTANEYIPIFSKGTFPSSIIISTL